MVDKKYPLIVLISCLCSFYSCSTCLEQTEEHLYQYQTYDLVYNKIVYIGVGFITGSERNQPQYIVHEVEEIKECYDLYGIDTLLHDFTSWYYQQKHPSKWTIVASGKEIPWNDRAENCIIYLALRNDYSVYRDDESGYLCFERRRKGNH